VSILDTLNKIATKVLGTSTYNTQTKQTVREGGWFDKGPQPEQQQYNPPVTQTYQPTPTQEYKPTVAPTKSDYSPQSTITATPQVTTQPQTTPSLDNNTLTKMVDIYGGKDSKLLSYSQQLADATKHDFWKNNPELLALIPHLETGSGRYITRPNNFTNWGINYPGNNEEFAKMTPAEVLQKFIDGIASNSPYYEKFRTGAPLTDQELLEFAKVYEPANPDYGPNLVNGRKHIRNTMGWPELS